MRVPIYLPGDMTADEIEALFRSVGLAVHSEQGRLVAKRLPQFLKKEENVRDMAARPRKVGSK